MSKRNKGTVYRINMEYMAWWYGSASSTFKPVRQKIMKNKQTQS
jgi:hypothetical protein